jgi:chromosome segregation protein
MAEVVMHMIRDEVDEVEPDIEDIDSTLERIDDRLVNLDEILPQEQEAASEPSAVAPGDDTAQAPAPDSEQAAQQTPTQKITHKRHCVVAISRSSSHPAKQFPLHRRLYRSGESEYLLNGKICRLRDIRNLFSETGLAGGHYAIIEAGPYRTDSFREADGPAHQSSRKQPESRSFACGRERLRRGLESARSNLSRISDIVAEIDRQVNSLRRQAAKSASLRRVARRVARAAASRLRRRRSQARDRSRRDESKLAKITELELGIADDLSNEKKRPRATHEARSLEDELSTSRAAAAEAVLRRDRQARECVYQQEQLSEIEKAQRRSHRRDRSADCALVLIEAECRRLQQEDASCAKSLTRARSCCARLKSRTRKTRRANAAEIEIESARAELLSQTRSPKSARDSRGSSKTTLERLSQQAEGLAREGDRAASQHAERKLEAESLRASSATRVRVSQTASRTRIAVDAVCRGHEAVSDTEAELTRVRDEHSRASHRLESLKELDQRRATIRPPCSSSFRQRNAARFHFIGTLADALERRCEVGTRGRRRARIFVAVDRGADARRRRSRGPVAAREQRRSREFPRRRFARRQ